MPVKKPEAKSWNLQLIKLEAKFRRYQAKAHESEAHEARYRKVKKELADMRRFVRTLPAHQRDQAGDATVTPETMGASMKEG